MNPLGKVVLVGAVGVIALGGALAFFGRGDTSGPPTPTPTLLPTSTPAPTASDAACRLLTSDEVANAGGNPGLGALPGAGGTGARTSCVYQDGGGNIVVRTDLTKPGGTTAFADAQAIPGVEAQAGLSAEAVFDPATGILYVHKGDAMVAIRPGFFAETAAERLSMARTLAEILIPRL